MKRKFLYTSIICGLTLASGFAVLAKDGRIVKADETGVTWYHYAKKEATASTNGNREYWINCVNHTPVFSKPSTGTIEEGENFADFSSAPDSDARKTSYLPNAFKSEALAWRYFRHNGWGKESDWSNGVFQITTNVTITYKFLQDAHELGIKYVYFNVRAVGKADTVTTVPLTAVNTTGEFSDGKDYCQPAQSAEGKVQFTFDIENWYSCFTGDRDAENVTAFSISGRNSGNADAEIETITFSDLKCFDSKEEMEAYASLNNILNTNGWDYFHYGKESPAGNGKKLTFYSGDSSFTVTKKMVEDVKAIGKEKVIFNLKISSSDNAALTHVVWLSEFASGTNDAGETVNWQTDYKEFDADLTTTGATIELNVGKLFGDNVTFNNSLAYRIQGRLAGANDCYSAELITFVVSDIHFE